MNKDRGWMNWRLINVGKGENISKGSINFLTLHLLMWLRRGEYIYVICIPTPHLDVGKQNVKNGEGKGRQIKYQWILKSHQSLYVLSVTIVLSSLVRLAT